MLRRVLLGGNGRRLASSEVTKSGPSGLAVPLAEVKLTRLPNQMMVSTVQSGDVGGTKVAVAMKAGSRYEGEAFQGVSQRLALLAGLGAGYDSKVGTGWKLANAGVDLDVKQGRDLLIFTANTSAENKKDALKILAEVLMDPGLRAWELSYSQETLLLQAQKRAADPANVLDDLIHKVAYRGHGLGAPLYAREGSLSTGPAANTDAIAAFFHQHFVSGGTALLGVNLDHDYLLDYSADALPLNEAKAPSAAPSPYVGGGEEHQHWAGPFTRLIWAGEGASWQDAKGLATQACLMQLLAGQTSAPWCGGSHGGKAKAALSAALSSANFSLQPYYAPHADTGLVGFRLAASSPDISKALKATLDCLAGLGSAVDAAGLEGAKKRASLELLEETEKGGALIEISLNQVLAGPNFNTPADFADAIAAVTAADVQNLAKKLSSGKASLASLGDPKYSPSL